MQAVNWCYNDFWTFVNTALTFCPNTLPQQVISICFSKQPESRVKNRQQKQWHFKKQIMIQEWLLITGRKIRQYKGLSTFIYFPCWCRNSLRSPLFSVLLSWFSINHPRQTLDGAFSPANTAGSGHRPGKGLAPGPRTGSRAAQSSVKSLWILVSAFK